MKKTLGTRNNNEWTEGRYRSFLVSILRSGMRRWPPKWLALKAASVGKHINKKSGRAAEHYTCAMCSKNYPAKEVQIDHIHPVVDPDIGFISWDVYIERMFCEQDNLQVLCLTCHKKKSKEERGKR